MIPLDRQLTHPRAVLLSCFQPARRPEGPRRAPPDLPEAGRKGVIFRVFPIRPSFAEGPQLAEAASRERRTLGASLGGRTNRLPSAEDGNLSEPQGERPRCSCHYTVPPDAFFLKKKRSYNCGGTAEQPNQPFPRPSALPEEGAQPHPRPKSLVLSLSCGPPIYRPPQGQIHPRPVAGGTPGMRRLFATLNGAGELRPALVPDFNCSCCQRPQERKKRVQGPLGSGP